MNGRRAITALFLVVLALPAWSAVAPHATRRTPAAAGSTLGTAVAIVGSVPLAKAELDQRADQAVTQYRHGSGNRELPTEMLDLLRRQVLESMIRMQLLAYEADRTGQRATPAEEEDELRHAPVFNPGGKFDAARFDMIKTTQKPAFDAALAGIGRQIGARRLYSALESRFLPTETEARAAASRQLTRALVDHLTLRAADFKGTYPEPRESQVLDWYAAHRTDYRQPDRATLTVAFVNTPGLPDSLRGVPGRMEAWTRRMKSVADSLAGLLQRGASYDSVTRDLGQRANIVVTSDNLPGYWRGTPAQAARLFDLHGAGRPIAEALPAAEGFLLVRTDEVTPAHVATLREVAPEIRGLLRRDSRLHHDDHDARALYAQVRDSLEGEGYGFRYAVVDTSRFANEAPSESDLEHYFGTHQADYSSFDPKSGAIVVRPLAEVRGEIAARWRQDERLRAARLVRDQIVDAWSSGRRDPAAEARAVVRESAPAVSGTAIDTGYVAAVLSDTLWNLGTPHGTGVVQYRRGWIAWTVTSRADHVIPTYEQARPELGRRLAIRRAAAEQSAARAFFDTDSMRFNLGRVLHFSRLSVVPAPLLTVPLNRTEVEKWYHDHIDKYSAAELVTARHILIRPRDGSPAADSAARELATSLLQRAQAGEDFAELARQFSDDPATRDAGGDLGAFARGTMLAAFEKAAFALSAGQICDHVVRTEVGYHVIRCTDHVPAFVNPLPLIYSNVSLDAANEKAVLIARHRADSLIAACPTLATLSAGARKLGYAIAPFTFVRGRDLVPDEEKSFFTELEALTPGKGHTAPHYVKGDGFWIAWPDSVTPPVAPVWDDVKDRVIAEYRQGAGARALEAKRAELDSLTAAGWAFDSLAALWGGPEKALDVALGHGLAGMGVTAEFDSLVFGTPHGEPMAKQALSGWLHLPSGLSRIRVTDRLPGSPDQVASRANTMRGAELERRLRVYFDELRKRYPVRILDPSLRDVALIEPPPGMTP